MWGCHRGALEEIVAKVAHHFGGWIKGVLEDAVFLAITVLVNVNVTTGCDQVETRAPVGVIGEGFVHTRSSDCDDICIIGGRIADCACAIIAGSSDNRHVLAVGIGQGVFQDR